MRLFGLMPARFNYRLNYRASLVSEAYKWRWHIDRTSAGLLRSGFFRPAQVPWRLDDPPA
jgi:hypothetical protein